MGLALGPAMLETNVAKRACNLAGDTAMAMSFWSLSIALLRSLDPRTSSSSAHSRIDHLYNCTSIQQLH